ncbi:MAG: hypothetical protein EBS53_14990, partial [Bacteroidetes bacterium]|nr:hypothetical protein [Bacteroidota bacterium]
DSIRWPARTFNDQGLTAMVEVKIAPKDQQYGNQNGDWKRFFSLKGDHTDEVWCAQRSNGPIACGTDGAISEYWAIGSWEPNNYFGKRVQIALVVANRSMSLYINKQFVQTMKLHRDFRFGQFDNMVFGNSALQPWQGLNATFEHIKVIPQALTSEQVASVPISATSTVYLSALNQADQQALAMQGSDGDGASGIQTQLQVQPWWKAHLGVAHCVSGVRIWDQTKTLNNFYLELLDDSLKVKDFASWAGGMNTQGYVDIRLNQCDIHQVRVRLAGDTARSLKLDEVEVFGSSMLNTIAQGKRAAVNADPASAAVTVHTPANDYQRDGDSRRGDRFVNLDIPGQSNPYWEVLLGRTLPHYVASIRIWNKTDGRNPQEESEMAIKLLGKDGQVIKEVVDRGPATQVRDIYIHSSHVYKVRVEKIRGSVQLAEVEVNGYHMLNVALDKGNSAQQSSTYGAGYEASKAIDYVAGAETQSRTEVQWEPWWELDLGTTHVVHEVRLHNLPHSGHYEFLRMYIQLIGVKDKQQTVISQRIFESSSIPSRLDASIYGTGVTKVRIMLDNRLTSLRMAHVEVLGMPTSAEGFRALIQPTNPAQDSSAPVRRMGGVADMGC